MKRRMMVALAAAGLLSGLAGCSVTPQPLTQAELALMADTAMAGVTTGQEPVTRNISLYEAMARALKYNLDHRVELMARDVADMKLNAARHDMLPALVANSHYAGRDHDPHSFSESLSGVRSFEPSTSRDHHTLSKDLSFSWNILDFGLSYVRARQAADQALIATEQKRKVINRIIEDVRTAYWRAVSADRLLEGFRKLERRVENALANSRALAGSGHTSPAAALTFQRELVDIKRSIRKFEGDLRTSRIQLAALMNLEPGASYGLVVPERRISALEISIPPHEMVRLALENRPELRENAYKARINAMEAEAAILELLPGIQLYAGANFDSNSFLLENNWVAWGAKASWNLMRLFQYPARKGVIESESRLLRERELALAMAMMTQVEVARFRYHHARRTAATAAEFHKVQSAILDQVRAASSAGGASSQSLVREEMNTLVSSIEYDMAYASLQNAFAGVYASIGVDPWGDVLDTTLPVDALADHLKSVWKERGDHAG